MEDLNLYLREVLTERPHTRVPSADTVLRGIEELETENISYTAEKTGNVYDFNTAERLNLCVYLYECGREDDLHLGTDVLVGHGVVVHVASEIDTAVFLDRQLGIELDLIAFPGQRAQAGLLNGQEQFLMVLRALLHASLVALPHLLEDGRIHVLDGIECLIAQRCHDPAVEDLHMVFHVRFVLGMYRAYGDGNTAVVVTEVLEDLVELRHALLALDDG